MKRLLPVAIPLGLALLLGCGGAPPAPAFDTTAPRSLDPAARRARVEALRLRAEVSPEEPYWPYRLGAFYTAVDSLESAEAFLVEALDRDPSYAPAAALYGKLLYESGRHETAVEMLETARDRWRERPDPRPPFPRRLLAGLALHLEALGDTARLAEVRQRLASENTGEAYAESVLPFVLLRGAEFRSAVEPARCALDAAPESAVNLNNYGITQLQNGDPEGARATFLRAIAADEGLPGPYYNLALAETFYLFDAAAARKWFDRYLSLADEDPDGVAEALTATEEAP